MTKNNYKDYTREQLIVELKKLSKRKKYGLVWEEEKTKERFEAAAEGKLPVLVEEKKREIQTDKNKPTNILIEGDNYHALSVLNYTHAKSIDVMYFDPPYNTGARDWKYNNDYVEEEDSFRHSKWLSMMEKRLKLAKKLLAKNGVLIVTIDDNEACTLGLLLDEIFTEKERATIVIKYNPAGTARNGFSRNHEYAYFLLNKGQEIEKKPAPRDIRDQNLRRHGSGANRTENPTMFYPIFVEKQSLKIIGVGEVPHNNFSPERQTIEKKNHYEIWPLDNKDKEKRWYYGKERVKTKGSEELTAKWVKDRLHIYFHTDNESEQKYPSVWIGSEYDSGAHGGSLVRNIVGKEFPFPKSLYAVKDCLKAIIRNNKKAIVLDIFAGSGTTGHAVLDLNSEDEGQRQFILCTNNENNICHDITFPRIKKVIEGYNFTGTQKDLLFEIKLTPSLFNDIEDTIAEIELVIEKNSKIYNRIEKKVEENTFKIYGVSDIKDFKKGLGGNLKCYKTNFVGSEPTHRNKKLLTEKSVEMLCIKENTFEEVINKKDIAIFKNKEKYTAILFDEIKLDEFKNEIKKLKKPISVYVFSLEDDDFRDDFEGMKNDITLCSIPEAILKVYRRIYETAKPKK